ncbi:MAG: DUF1080 domain-containing protein [Bryobacteraceae bacterium]|nr:DUF1080 domain-containing protein [Bryobacteraceae bacterium]
MPRALIFSILTATTVCGAWVHEGPRATFSLRGGVISTTGAGNVPNWLHTSAEYENFRLKFDYKLAQWAEAAVILRAPRLGRPMQAGLAITLAHDFHNDHTPWVTGAIHGVRKPAVRMPVDFEKWHSVGITLDGNHLRVRIDETVVQDVQLDSDAELRHRLRRGFIGFPDLGYAYSVRGVEIEELPSIHKYISLLDGASLQGWELRNEGSWSVRESAIVGANGHGILYAPPVLTDFEFTALVRSSNRVNAGVFLRGSPDLKQHRGFEVQIYSPPDAVFPTGSIYGKKRSNSSADYEERWFLMQIRVEGARCAVRLDGVTVAEFDGLTGPDLKPGRIGLQIHMENASVAFRDLRVRPLVSQ